MTCNCQHKKGSTTDVGDTNRRPRSDSTASSRRVRLSCSKLQRVAASRIFSAVPLVVVSSSAPEVRGGHGSNLQPSVCAFLCGWQLGARTDGGESGSCHASSAGSKRSADVSKVALRKAAPAKKAKTETAAEKNVNEHDTRLTAVNARIRDKLAGIKSTVLKAIRDHHGIDSRGNGVTLAGRCAGIMLQGEGICVGM